MNAAVHILEDLSVAEAAASAAAAAARQRDVRARAPSRASLEHELRDVEASSRILLRNASGISSSSMPAPRWRSSRQSAAPQLFWGAETVLRSCVRAHCRPRAAALPSWASGSATWKAARRRCASRSSTATTRSTRSNAALFEVQYEEEQLSYEWEIEREIDEQPRKALLPWAYERRGRQALPQVRRARAAVDDAVQRDHFADSRCRR